MKSKTGVWGVVAGLALAAVLAARALGQKVSSSEPPARPDGEVVTPSGITLPSGLYDANADPVRDINRARDLARRDDRNVLVMWGENNCEFCVHLHRLYTSDPRIKRLIETEYELVMVDIGKFEKNLELATLYQTDLLKLGAPDLTVVNPSTNQAIAVMPGKDALAKPMTLQRVFDEDYVYAFLDNNKSAPKPAVPLLSEAEQKAGRDGKRVLVYFNVYGNDACRVWDKAANDAGVAALLDAAYVVRKIDVDRNPGGYDLLHRLKASATASPPWMTVLDATGKGVAEADGGREFDPGANQAGVADWLISAGGGKLNPIQKEALAAAIKAAIAPKSAKAAGDGGSGNH